VLLLDEITVDMDVVGRLDLLKFFVEECQTRGATIIYATHIFDGLEEWITHVAYLADGQFRIGASLNTAEEESFQALGLGARHRCRPHKINWAWALQSSISTVVAMICASLPALWHTIAACLPNPKAGIMFLANVVWSMCMRAWYLLRRWPWQWRGELKQGGKLLRVAEKWLHYKPSPTSDRSSRCDLEWWRSAGHALCRRPHE
jgi:energy-coupling factor transporter ATP-binding protein EcfA2